MKRNTTILTLCGLLLIADGICLWETLTVWPDLSILFAVSMLTGQIITAMLLSWMAFTVVQIDRPMRGKLSRQTGSGVWQPLRRIFVSVWP